MVRTIPSHLGTNLGSGTPGEPVLFGQLSNQPLLTLPPEAKLSKVSIPPTMLTMEGSWFWLLFWALFGLWLLLTWFLSLLLKELISQVTFELDGFLEIVGIWREHRWSWVVASQLLR
jgi:hypothetical protein